MIVKILLATLVGTSLMTVYTYIAAETEEEPLKPPILLNRLISQSPNFKIAVTSRHVLGWLLHYLVGLTFVLIYHLLWQYTYLEPVFLHGALMGLASGVAGISGWEVLFLMHSNPPKVNLKKYYFHLMIAHIVFGIGAVAGYQVL